MATYEEHLAKWYELDAKRDLVEPSSLEFYLLTIEMDDCLVDDADWDD